MALYGDHEYDFRADDETSVSNHHEDDGSLSTDAVRLTENDLGHDTSQTEPKELITTGPVNFEEAGVHVRNLTVSDQDEDSSQTCPKEVWMPPVVGKKTNGTCHDEPPKMGNSSGKRQKERRTDPKGSIGPNGLNIEVNGHFNQININYNYSKPHADPRQDGRGYGGSFKCKHRPTQEKVKLRVQKGVVSLATVHDVAEKVGADWRELGRGLNLRPLDLDVLEHDYRNDGAVEICYRMIATWLERKASQATYKNLGNALLEISRCDVVKDCLEEE